MHASFDRGTPAPALHLPVHLEQSTSRASVALRMVLLLPALAVLAVPLALLAAHAVAELAALNVLSDHPGTAVQIALGIAIWTALFVRPLQRLFARAGTSRMVDITADRVTVTERGLLRSRLWSANLASFRGVAHHVRTSLSGMRHELILVHADPAQHVLLAVADRIDASELKRTAALLGLPEVSARALYDR